MAAGSSVIPPRFQIPIVVVGSIVLIALGLRNFGYVGEGRQTLTPDSNTEVETQASTVDEMMALLSDAADAAEQVTVRDAEPPPLARDPFAIPGAVLQQLVSGSQGRGTGALAISGMSDGGELAARRQNTLESLTLTATVFLGGKATAILGGQYLREGDEIEGFIVKAIDERSVTIEDNQGEEIIGIAEESLP